LRAELGIGEDTHLLIFAGRGSKEKTCRCCSMHEAPGGWLSLAVGGLRDAGHVPDNVTWSTGFALPNTLPD
jgi:alpha-1,6-mannosyltransferase